MDFKELMAHIRRTRHTEQMENNIKYNEQVRKSWTPIWVRNAGRTYSEVERRFKSKDCDLRNLPRLNGEPVICLGSGPSLEDVLPILKDWKGKIACSTSHISMLEYMGIEPNYIFLIDADPSMEFLVRDYVRKDTNSILITHPQIPREIIEAWPDDKVAFFRMFDPGDTFSREYVPMMFGWMNQEKNWHIGSYILNSGNVVNAMVPALQALGAGVIFLCGYDLGYPEINGEPIYRSSTWFRKDNKWEYTPPSSLPSQQVRPIKYERSNNGILCDELCFFYKISFIILYGLGAVPVLSCSKGILSEIPYVDPKEVIEKQGHGFEKLVRLPRECYLIAQEYLRFRGIYIIKTDFGVETVNIRTKNTWGKYKYILHFYWMKSRPWKWMGGKGYIPRNMRKVAKTQGIIK